MIQITVPEITWNHLLPPDGHLLVTKWAQEIIKIERFCRNLALTAQGHSGTLSLKFKAKVSVQWKFRGIFWQSFTESFLFKKHLVANRCLPFRFDLLGLSITWWQMAPLSIVLYNSMFLFWKYKNESFIIKFFENSIEKIYYHCI